MRPAEPGCPGSRLGSAGRDVSTLPQAQRRVLFQELVERDGAACSYCGTPDTLVIDHKRPRSRGGSDEISNLQILCRTCNSQKGTLTEEEADQRVRFSSSVARAGFTVAHNLVLFDRNLTPQARLLYLQLRHYGWKDSDPDQAELAANLCIGERALRPYIEELKAAGLLRVTRRGRGKSNAYVLHEPAPQERQSTSGLFDADDRQYTSHQTGSTLPIHSKGKKEEEGSSSKELSPSPAPAENTPKQRPRDLIFEALEAIFGKAPEGRTARGRWNKAVADLKRDEATPEAIAAAARAYRRNETLGKCLLTPLALSGNFRLLVPLEAKANSNGRVAMTQEEAEAVREAFRHSNGLVLQ